MEEKTQNQVLKEISDYLKSAYLSENSLLSSNLTEAQLHMIELTSEICAKGTHPILILSSTSYEDLMGITGLNEAVLFCLSRNHCSSYLACQAESVPVRLEECAGILFQ
jgi:hypothetical protein